MIEAVAWQDHPVYFNKLAEFINPDTGRIALQTINIEPEQFASQKHNPNFANTAIFPGGVLTPAEEIVYQMHWRGLQIHGEDGVTDTTPSYAITTREWTRNLQANRAALTEKWLAEGIPQDAIDRFYKGKTFYLQASQAVSDLRPATFRVRNKPLGQLNVSP